MRRLRMAAVALLVLAVASYAAGVRSDATAASRPSTICEGIDPLCGMELALGGILYRGLAVLCLALAALALLVDAFRGRR
ncbi:MAG: hypothetical protein ACT4PT_08460 [Methanobacteriota archaeon]